VELFEKKEPDGVFIGWPNRWLTGVTGILVFHCCAEAYGCRTVPGVVGVRVVALGCMAGVLGVYGSTERAGE
jgi:hypothetical protein